MFILTKLADLVQIAPTDFTKLSIDSIRDYINSKYANRVIHKLGLCICLYDVLFASEGQIGHGNGYVNVNVEFRLVVFRPFKGEVMFGRIHSSSPAGIHLRTDFFDDIFVPVDRLPEGAEYSAAERLWIWNFDGSNLFYDNHEMVRFQVVDEEWHDQTPVGPAPSPSENPAPATAALSATTTPYKIIASMAQEGLGVCLWWDGQ